MTSDICASSLVCVCVCSEDLSVALEKLKLASADGAAASVDGCLDSLLTALVTNSEWSCSSRPASTRLLASACPPVSRPDPETSVKIQQTGLLPLLPRLLQPQSSCATRVANIIAEVAKNGTDGCASFTTGLWSSEGIVWKSSLKEQWEGQSAPLELLVSSQSEVDPPVVSGRVHAEPLRGGRPHPSAHPPPGLRRPGGTSADRPSPGEHLLRQP